MDWQKLETVHERARQAGVGYSLNYCEADSSWFFSVSSAAPSENWCGKNGSFDAAVERVMEWLERVLAGPNAVLSGKPPHDEL